MGDKGFVVLQQTYIPVLSLRFSIVAISGSAFLFFLPFSPLSSFELPSLCPKRHIALTLPYPVPQVALGILEPWRYLYRHRT